jgi:FAD/FMN-containing dehydrogenase/Fe-S oxidoreductase
MGNGAVARPFRGREIERLARKLRAAVHGEVRFDAGAQALYATDASNYRQVPIGTVIPRNVESIAAAVKLCHEFQAPLLMRGAGTSLAGQGCNAAVVIDTSKYMNQVIEIDPVARRARVQPGLICDDLRRAAEQHGLTFGPDPATHQYCTLGGMLGNNSCGVHSIMAGKTVENTEELEVLTYDGLRMRVGATSDTELARIIEMGGRRGEIYARLKALRDRYADLIRARYPRIPRRVSGYNLDELLPENGFHVARALVGSEGTCVVVLEAVMRLIPSPPVRVLVVLGFADVFEAADRVPAVMETGPIGLEGFDDNMIGNMKRKRLHLDKVALLPEGGGWLLAEFGGATREEAVGRAQQLIERSKTFARPPTAKLCENLAEQKKLWTVRESGLPSTSFVAGERDTWEGWEDAAVAPEKLGGYLRDLSELLTRYGYRYAFYGHFGHGCVHNRVDFDLKTAAGIRHFRKFIEEAADLVVGYGGSFSGEHGDGQSRAELLPKMYGPELIEAFREFKGIWDPQGKMNPHKVVDPYRIDENLRLGVHYRPKSVATHFAFAEDEGSFARAMLRCIGVAKCRKLETGAMCPSFMATREEAYSTRGRARLLFEMMQGETVAEGWHDEHVKQALDLCLACKACKAECPMKVDMATYKAEFLAHYYEGRLRPRAAYTMGLVPVWARLGARVPGLANFLTHAPGLEPLVKWLAGVAPERRIPRLARETFQQWFRRRSGKPDQRAQEKPGGQKVVLWPDTFTNCFNPEIARAAVEVLERAGCEVAVPRESVCCGRPFYDYGMLDQAKRRLARILRVLGGAIAEGVPVVILEPSCAAVFRDELVGLFHDDEDAHRLSQQSFLLSEFLERRLPGYVPPALAGRAIVHGHCHQASVMGLSDEEKMLAKLGLDYRVLDSGCCGMAGSFGFEKDHYEISLAIGERVLLPAVRNAAADTLVIADGFSCREQIAQATGRRALHFAEVLQRAFQAPAKRQ